MKNTNIEGAQISKDGSENDNAVAKAYDKNDSTEVQCSNNELFENVFAHNHDTKRDEQHDAENIIKDNKILKEANDLLAKELKMYKERGLTFENKPVKNTILKKEYDQFQTQFLIEKQKNEDLEKEKRVRNREKTRSHLKYIAQFVIIADTDNRPPMLEKFLYDSWKSHMKLYIENQENIRMILNSVQNGPLVWPTVVEEDGITMTNRYEEHSVAEKLQSDCDLKATNIVLQGDDPIACLNKAMDFLTAIASSRFPSTNNQLRTSYNPRNQATIPDGRVIVQRAQGRLGQSYESGQNLDEEELAFLADPGILDGQAAQTTIPNTVAFQTEDLDAYDSDCDDVFNAKIMSQDVMICVMNSTAFFDAYVNVEMHCSELCVKCLDLDAEDTYSDNQNSLQIPKYFKNNNLKAKLQAKDTTICKLKEHIKSMTKNDKEEKVKHDMDEIETITIELEHSVGKLLSKNKRLLKEIKNFKKIYKDQFDSIKKTRALSKEQCDSLIAKLSFKSMENADLKGQIQEKVFVTTSLQNELRKLKGKNVLDNAATITNVTTIAPGMFKLDLDPLAFKLLKNKEAHIDYLKYTQEQADVLQGIVEQAKTKQPLDNALDFAYKHAK
nr:hypothetical protein [Tanacetum cinerariifolium]